MNYVSVITIIAVITVVASVALVVGTLFVKLRREDAFDEQFNINRKL